jgi:hypothetical protein
VAFEEILEPIVVFIVIAHDFLCKSALNRARFRTTNLFMNHAIEAERGVGQSVSVEVLRASGYGG